MGNPFLLIELVGCFDPENDSFEPIPLHEVLTRKLGRLPAEAAHLLDVLAVSGQALALEEASHTAGHALIPMDTITRMRNERLLRTVGPDDHQLVDTYHDRVRETILDRMGEDHCKSIHRTLAGVIEQATGGLAPGRLDALQRGRFDLGTAPPIARVFDLAYHYDVEPVLRKAKLLSWMPKSQVMLLTNKSNRPSPLRSPKSTLKSPTRAPMGAVVGPS